LGAKCHTGSRKEQGLQQEKPVPNPSEKSLSLRSNGFYNEKGKRVEKP
jgi:hypothetical protein